jgi:hypothetical protein
MNLKQRLLALVLGLALVAVHKAAFGAEPHVRGMLLIQSDPSNWHCSASAIGMDVEANIVYGLTARHCLEPISTWSAERGAVVMPKQRPPIYVRGIDNQLYPVTQVQVKGDAVLFSFKPAYPVIHQPYFLVARTLPALFDRIYSYGYLSTENSAADVQPVLFVGIWTSLGERTTEYVGITWAVHIVQLPAVRRQSGGPIFNAKGEVIGVYSIGSSGAASPWTGVAVTIELTQTLEVTKSGSR